LDLRKYYSRFLDGHGDNIHLAAHSHHFWPDVSREGHMEYWDDCAKSSDQKWDKIFSEIIPYAQNKIADILNLKDPQQIVFAPNTHELTSRLLSTFLGTKNLSVLTTDSEFHSWKRQITRLEELDGVNVSWLSTKNLLNDRSAFLASIIEELKKAPDLFFISQVFFDSGLALSTAELESLLPHLHQRTTMVIDGYHGFAAIPTDLSSLEGKVFYLAGGYKYAQAGEGAAFMVIPQKNLRPAYTGWFAQFANLSQTTDQLVGYSQDFMSFMGSTQDMSGLYRFRSVWQLFDTLDLDIKTIHNHVKALQKKFLSELNDKLVTKFDLTLIWNESFEHGHFLTYLASSEEKASEVEKELKEKGVLIDRRANRLRFGFGLYHTEKTLVDLEKRLNV
ncbi:MAG: aminotransferase class V-fold PLP-dependent enzyme, partial [Bacteriovoracaceae bacterium]